MRLAAAALLALLVLPALAAGAPTTHAERRIERLVALPFVNVATLAEDDAASYRVDVPEGVAVAVDIVASPGSIFLLRWSSWDGTVQGSPLPSARQSLTLPKGSWSVQVDPLAGASVRIVSTFDGRVVDSAAHTPAAFTLFDVAVGCGCVAGVRLP